MRIYRQTKKIQISQKKLLQILILCESEKELFSGAFVSLLPVLVSFCKNCVKAAENEEKLAKSRTNLYKSGVKRTENVIADCHTNFHLYHYAGNNPVKYTDPTGKSVDYDLGEISIEISSEDFIAIRDSLKQELESVNKAETWKEKLQTIFNAICGKAVDGVPLLGSLYDIYDGMNTLTTILSGMEEVDQQTALNRMSDVLADYFRLTETTDKKPQVSIVLNIKASGKSEYISGAV